MSRDLIGISAADASLPAAHYSQAMQVGDLVWTAGTVGRDPLTQRVVSDRFEEQVEQSILNVQAVLRAAGTDLTHVVKSTCFVTRREDFQTMDSIYRRYFGTPPPARTTIVCDLVFEDLLFEIEVVAHITAASTTSSPPRRARKPPTERRNQP
jgi:2-iminobutanoate/2-iminopropanoate deaminase